MPENFSLRKKTEHRNRERITNKERMCFGINNSSIKVCIGKFVFYILQIYFSLLIGLEICVFFFCMYYFNNAHIGKHLIFQFANIYSAKRVDKHLHRNSAIYSKRFFMFSVSI